MSDTPVAARQCPFAPQAHHMEILHGETMGEIDIAGRKYWLVAKAEDVRLVTNDSRFSSDPVATNLMPATRPGWFSGMDLPEHNRYRQKIARDFTLRRAQGEQEWLERTADELLDRIGAAGDRTELVTTYTNVLSSLAINRLYGVDEDEAAQIDESLRSTSLNAHRTSEPFKAFLDCVLELVRAKRSEGGEGLLHRLALPGDGDGDTVVLTEDEAAGVFATLLVAGNQSAQRTLAFSVYTLLSHPGQSDLLRKQPELIDSAVDELLRYVPVNQMGVPRSATEDVELRGQRIQAGDVVIPLPSTANRDPEVFPEPDVLDLTRTPNGHFAFGHGIHKCPGQHLTRVLLKVGLTRLFARFPDLRFVDGHENVTMAENSALYSPAELHVTWGSAP
jgi:cytochrome P450 C-9 hydroxylase